MPRPADVGVNPAAESQIELLNKLGELSEFISFESKHKRLHSIYSEKDLSTSLTKMYRSAKASLEENGASTLYLALGMLRWFEQKKNAQARIRTDSFWYRSTLCESLRAEAMRCRCGMRIHRSTLRFWSF